MKPGGFVIGASTLVQIMAIVSVALLMVSLLLFILQRQDSERKQRALEEHKSEFLALAAHYFLTPLSVIKGKTSELLDPQLANLGVGERYQYYLSIQANTNRLLRLIQNVSTIAAIDSGELRAVITSTNIINEIDRAVAEVHAEAVEKNINVHFVRPTQVIMEQVRIDTQKFYQALVNILGNAVKFTTRNGSIEVDVTENNKGYTIRIADSGVGITPEEMTKLFTRFHRGTSYLNMEYEGVGLGLYLAKYLIEACGGTISIQSEVNRGTVVTVFLSHG